MKKQAIIVGLASSFIFSSAAFAAIPSPSAVVEDKGYDLDYLMKSGSAQVHLAGYAGAGNPVYVKLQDNLFLNLEGVPALKDVIPALTYYDSTGQTTQYAAQDGDVIGEDQGELKVESVSAINAKQVEIKFNKAVKEDSVIEATGAGKGTLVDTVFAIKNLTDATSYDADASKATLSKDGKTLTINADAAKSFEGKKLVVQIAKDKAVTADGEKLGEYTSPIIEVKDTVAPKVASVEKIHSTQYKIVFSEPVKPGITVSGKLTDGTDASVTKDETNLEKGELVINLGGTYTNKDVEVTLIGVKDYADNLISPNPAVVNVTKGDLDGVKPTVSSVNVLSTQQIEIKFSEELQAINVTDIKINDLALTDPTDKLVQDKTDKTKYTITLGSALTPGFNTISIDARAVKDLSGEEIDAWSKVIEVKADQVAPALTSSKVVKDLKDGKEYLVVKFDKDVTLDKLKLTDLKSVGLDAKKVKDYVTETVTIKAKSTATGGFVAVDDSKSEYKIALAELIDGATDTDLLAKDATYTIDLPASAVKNLDGTASKEQEAAISFVRGSDSLVDEQEVNSVATTIDGTANNTVTVNFKQEVDGASATNVANYKIDSAVVEKAELQSDKKTVILTLEKGKTTFTGERYITIDGVKTKDGVAMKKAHKEVIELNENIAPKVEKVEVIKVEHGTSPQADVTVKLTFSENVTATNATDNFDVLVDGEKDTDLSVAVTPVTDEKDVEVVISFDDVAKFSKSISLQAATDLDIADSVKNKADITVIKIK